VSTTAPVSDRPPLGTDVRRRHGSNIGQALTRLEGALKVTGRARFTADNTPPGLLYAVLAVSGIARGRLLALDVKAARSCPGVVEVMTCANRPPLAQDPDAKLDGFMFRLDLLQNDHIRYANQPIGVVIAESLEAAVEGAALLNPTYDSLPTRAGLDGEDSFIPPAVGAGSPAQVEVGDVADGLAAAAVRVEQVYETAAQYHNPLEPHSIVAAWDGDTLSIDTPSQALAMAQDRIADLFGIPKENILIRSPFLGGGFGSKAFMSGPQILGVLAARLVGRPIKLVLTRDQMFGPVGHRAPTRQSISLGTDGEGRLTAIRNHTRTATSAYDDFYESAADVVLNLYASPSIATSHEAVRLDIGTPTFMRAPGEAPGSLALESAMDEAAFACRVDPLDFRLRNYAEVEPKSGKPYSSKALRECYAEGARRFGWAKRPLSPRSMRDDAGLLVGWGVGTAAFPAGMFPANARAILTSEGRAVIEAGAHDMGQGALTALVQIAADSLGLPMDAVEFRSGRSDLPDAGIAGGSMHTASAGMAIHAAGQNVIAKLAQLAFDDERSPLKGAGNAGVAARQGRLYRVDDEQRSESFVDILKRAGLTELQAAGSAQEDPVNASLYAKQAHGAVFAEVKVDPDLCQIRTTRLVGVFAAGQIINPRLVRSQLYGGLIWGISLALHEAAITDPRSGRIMNADLGDYLIPVNADAPCLEVATIHEDDPYVNPLGIKGVGEIGITGTAGAIANAVWHATGVRPRRFPIRIEDLIAG